MKLPPRDLYPGDELLTLKECETRTKRKVSTWRKDIRLQKVACVRLGRQIRIPRSVIDAMIGAGFRPAQP
jgi:hypothetical protein